ncbi:DUF4382 domain-containing protein [Halapricum hydrolyticum]|uniref:DUF4382 domain-containing protein n=1 Tax=Halapricum hydrolyticum TaxID=2979991 RepID=A0AAE3IEJ3_9EURY|nr:DUF4382 domain-containing protein [Halapricum hydrolyticum]MCU4719183.1 DUF4382 domain-containing protein [Halapricum hydrolyticum]MCU4728274.1 DUF4382 domain-containing protein [Halapricum hydrolyticum]
MRDATDETSTYRREYLKAAGAVGLAGAIGLAGCSENASAATGTLATAVKDAPGDIEDFETCVVTVEGVWLKPGEADETTDPETDTEATDETTTDVEETADETTDTEAAGETTTDAAETEDETTDEEVTEQTEEDVDESDRREYYEFEQPQEADLVQLQDGNSKLVDEREVPVGTYQFLQLDVSNVEATLVDGGDAEIDTPGNAPLQFKHAFDVREDQRTVFTADFTPVKRGRTNRYLLQPVAKGTDVTYESATTSEPATDTTTDNMTDEPATNETA